MYRYIPFVIEKLKLQEGDASQEHSSNTHTSTIGHTHTHKHTHTYMYINSFIMFM